MAHVRAQPGRLGCSPVVGGTARGLLLPSSKPADSLERPSCGCWLSARRLPWHSRRRPRPQWPRRQSPTKSSARRGKEATSRTLPRRAARTCQSDEKSKDEAAPPAYKLLRYEEDYSYLKDPSRRTDFWDPIKYIPLWGRDDWYLSVGGEVRERYEFVPQSGRRAGARQRKGNNPDSARALPAARAISTSAPTSASSDNS